MHRRTPWANTGLIGVIAVMFLIQTWMPVVESTLLLRPYEPSLWGMVGSGFLHGGWMHLLSNLLFLYIFGNDLDDLLGHVGYIAFFLGGVVAASLVHSLLADNPALGASGGVTAVTGLYLAMFPRARVQLLFLFFIITMISVPAVWFIGIYFVIDLLGGLDSLLLGNSSGVARWAHVGGAVYGFGVGLLLDKAKLVPVTTPTVFGLLAQRREKKARRNTNQAHSSATDILPKELADPVAQQTQDLKGKIREHLDAKHIHLAAAEYVRLITLDERQVLPAPDQITIAESLYRDGKHAPAATAFERYLERYGRPRDAESAQARLMLGLLQSRYLDKKPEAVVTLTGAAQELEQIGDDDHAAFAREELERLK